MARRNPPSGSTTTPGVPWWRLTRKWKGTEGIMPQYCATRGPAPNTPRTGRLRSMRITILGGGGFLGRKLATRLARDGALGGQRIEALTLFDMAPPQPLDAPFPVT